MIIVSANVLSDNWLRNEIILSRRAAKFALTELIKHDSKNIICNKNKIYLGLNFTDSELLRTLNLRYKNKNQATDILSFTWHTVIRKCQYLGDIFLSKTEIVKYVNKYNITLDQRLVHLTIHGILHIFNYDHEQTKQAEIMESLENHLLQKFGFDCPYLL